MSRDEWEENSRTANARFVGIVLLCGLVCLGAGVFLLFKLFQFIHS